MLGNGFINLEIVCVMEIEKAALPKGWRWVKLEDVCVKYTGIHDPRSQPNQEFKYVDISCVDNARKQIIEVRSLQGKDAPSRARQIIKAGDVILSTTRPNLNAVAMVPAELDGAICSTGFCVLRPNTPIDGEYLFLLMQTENMVKALSDLVQGALYPAVTDKQVMNQSIPLPPLPEQKRIAAILKEQLAAVEQARRGSEARLEAAQALSAAYLKEVFENKDAVRWPRKRFGNVANLVRGRFSHRPRNDPRFYGGDYPWIQTSKVETSGKYITSYESTLNDKGLAVSKLFPKGTLVMTIAATIGAVGILSFDTCMPDSLVAVIPNEQEAETEYLYYLLTHIRKNMQSLAPRMAQANLKLELINPIEIPIPSLYIQGRVISYLNQKIDEAKNIENLLFEEYLAINSFPTSILHKAFSERL